MRGTQKKRSPLREEVALHSSRGDYSSFSSSPPPLLLSLPYSTPPPSPPLCAGLLLFVVLGVRVVVVGVSLGAIRKLFTVVSVALVGRVAVVILAIIKRIVLHEDRSGRGGRGWEGRKGDEGRATLDKSVREYPLATP